MAEFFRLDIRGLGRVLQGIERTIADFDTHIHATLRQCAEETLADLESSTPEGTGRTGGHLRESYFVRDASPLWLQVGTTQYTKLVYVTEGTGIYGRMGQYIVPVYAKALWWPEAGHPRARVRGQPANPFLDDVTLRAYDYADEAFQRLAALLASEVQGGL